MDSTTSALLAAAPLGTDRCSREMRFEFDGRANSVGVYDLTAEEQRHLLLPGHLPSWDLFLPDFCIVYGSGDNTPDGPRWTDLHVHVGGIQWPKTETGRSAIFAGPLRRPASRSVRNLASCEWRGAEHLAFGKPRGETPPAPRWLDRLIRERTPWGPLLDAAKADPPFWAGQPVARRTTR